MNSPPAYNNSPPGVPNTAPHNGAPMQYGQGQVPVPGSVVYIGGPQQPYQYNTGPRVYQNYLSRQSLGLGVTMIVCGVLCIIFNGVAIGLGSVISFVGYGIWGGIWFIITGSFGISAAKWKTTCKIVTFMVLSIISSCISLVLVVLAPFSAALDSYYGSSRYYSICNSYSYYYNSYGYSNSRSTLNSNCLNAAIAMESLQAILGFIVGIASIWGAALCCKAACCCNNYNRQAYAQPQFIPMQGSQQVVFFSQQQQQQQQGYPNPGPYPAQMCPGYPAPMMTNTEIGVSNAGYVNHSAQPGSANQSHGISDSVSLQYEQLKPH